MFLSLSPSLPLSLKSISMPSGEDWKKKSFLAPTIALYNTKQKKKKNQIILISKTTYIFIYFREKYISKWTLIFLY